MKGGSIASSSVEQLVPVQAFEKLDLQFDNQIGGKKQTKTNKKTTKKQSSKKKQQGGVCFVCGGSMKHINDFENEGIFNLYNKKGGANSPTFSMSYDYIDSMSKPVHGAPVPRGLDTSVMSVTVNETTSSLGSMNKIVEYGNVMDAPKIAFNYIGGSKKPVKKPAKKTQKPKTAPKKVK